MNKQNFIEKSSQKHNNLYQYTLVNYINNKTKVIITCLKHGNFEQRPDAHLRGQGCKLCSIEIQSKKFRKELSKFITDAKKIHYENPYELIRDKIIDFTHLKYNWDGYGIADSAISFVASLNSSYIDAISDIYPNPHGTITIEWENEKSEMLSLEIGETNYSYFIKYNNKDPKFVNGQDIMPSIQAIALELDELLVENSPLFFF